MQRRTLLSLGIVGAAAVSVVGGTLALLQPARDNASFTKSTQEMLSAVARSVLGSLLHEGASSSTEALKGHLQRLQDSIAGMPQSMQSEVDELLAIVASGPGRRVLVGLTSPWTLATTDEVAAALQDMRISSLSLRQQAYHALRDLTNAAHFADRSSWAAIGYDGPRNLSSGAPV
jgi:hypothetical protein